MLTKLLTLAVALFVSEPELACCTDPAFPSSCWVVEDDHDLQVCDPADVTALCYLDDAGWPVSCREITLTCIDAAGTKRVFAPGETCEGYVVYP
jgi:hypothetical protein